MGSLGEFGLAKDLDSARKEGADFTWYGKKVRLVDLESVGILPVMEFMAVAAGEPYGSAAGLAGMYRLLEQVIDPVDWPTFRGVKGVEVEPVVELTRKIVGVVTGVPTQRPSESSDGPPTTGQDSGPPPSETPRQRQLRENAADRRPVEELAAELGIPEAEAS